MIVGVPGSGKSTLAKALARKLTTCVLISKDDIQTPLLGDDRTSEHYSKVRKPTYEIMLQLAKTQLELGKIPLIESTFSHNHNWNDELKDWVTPFQRLAQSRNTTLRIIRCKPPSIEEHRRRIEQRALARDQWKLHDWKEFERKEPVDFPIHHSNVLEIVTDKESEKLADVILAHLSKK